MKAVRRTTEAGIAALHGQVDESVAAYEQAAASWRELRTPFDLALCGLDAVFLLPPDDRPSELVAEARQTLTRIGAAPFLAMADKCDGGG